MTEALRAQIATLEVSLRRYLPAQLADPLIARPDLATAQPCDAHLDALLRAVATYLPRYLVKELMQDPQPGQVSGQFRDATIMFADISGFTAMSEQLSRQGEQGAETITNIVGDYFTTMLGIADQHGGDLLKFGGDALLVAFLNEDHAMRACRAAVEMQRAIARFSEVEAFGTTYALQMTIGLGSGPLFTANLGTAQKMEYTVMGEALTNMARAEDQAEGGEIFIDSATYRAAGAQIEVGENRRGCYLLVGLQDGAAASAQPQVEGGSLEEIIHPPGEGPADDGDPAALVGHLADNLARLDALVPFLPPGLLSLLRFDPLGMASRARGEFRPVTVIFANFYGIDEIIQRLGPPRTAEITAILNAHFSRMHEIINRYEGAIDKVDSYVVGHRIMALFGAPRAHVDDPERAVGAAWEMQAAMAAFSELQTSEGSFALKQRIGINTGRVFAGNVGSDTRHEYSVMGDEVNLTARLMSAAQEDQLLISQSTADEVGSRFRLSEQAPVRVKGKTDPVPNYEVQGSLERRSTATGRRTPLVGRDEPFGRAWSVAQRVLQGQSGVLAVYGEMGMGKSRVVEELDARWSDEGGTAYLSTCLSYGRHTPYAPWIDLLRQVLGLREQDTDQERSSKIVSRLATDCPDWIEWAALVGSLLGVPMEESELIRSLDAQLRQQNLQRLVSDLIASEAAYHPALLVIDDIQWIDEVSMALLDHLVMHLPDGPLLVCLAYRPEEQVSIASAELGQAVHTEVLLAPLTREGSLALLDSQLPTAPEMPQHLKDVILKNAQGNPLFIVEMAHALIENYLVYDPETDVFRPRTDLDRVQVPDSVSRVILSRLDRLDEHGRNMLRVASVIGRTFQQWLLQSVYPYEADEATIEAQLLDMCEKELLDRGEVMYLFRHVMTREVAYESLLYADRRSLHRRIARTIEEQLEARLDEYVEVLAEHYTLAESWPEALDYQLRAGLRAQDVYANEDAIHRYRTALEVCAHLEDSGDARLTALEGLGDTYHLVGRYDEALDSYARAISTLEGPGVAIDMKRRRGDLCRRTARVYESRGEYEQALEWVDLGLALLPEQESIETAHLCIGGAAVHHRLGRSRDAIEWSERGLQIVEQLGTRESHRAAAHAYYLLGFSYHRLGTTEKAVLYYERSLDTYQAIEDSQGTARAQNNLANFYFDQDDWVRATEFYQQALVTLNRIGDLFGQAAIGNNLGEILMNRGQLDSARTLYQRSLDIAQELGIGGLVGLLYNNLGHTHIRAQEWDQALAYLKQSLALFERISFEEFLPELYRHLAEAHLGQGQVDEALSWAEKSLARALGSEARLEEGWTRRVLGSVHRAGGDLETAQSELESSLTILEDLDNPYQVARTAVELSAVYADLGETSRATRLRQEAVATFDELGAELDLANAAT